MVFFNRTFHLFNLQPSAVPGVLLSIDTKQSNVFLVFLFMLSLEFAPCLISSHPSAPLGALLSIETKQSNEKPN